MKEENEFASYRSRLHKVIPGGAHTYSRGDDQFPANAPSILEKGEGAYVWDTKGNKFLDYGMGLRSVNIGYGNKEVADAVYKEIIKGNNLTRASTTELQAAELLVNLIPSVEMVKFAKHGSSVTTAAVKIARAYTGKKYIAIPEEQPFFSFDDWFIGSTLMNKGSLEESSNYTLKFKYNDIRSLQNLFDQYPDQIAGVMLEPATTLSPCNDSCKLQQPCNKCLNNNSNFLHQVKALAHQYNAIFILDEMITGFRWDIKGAQSYFNVEPDLCTFGKAMANGFAVAALAGKREFMKLGDILSKGQERVFLTSTTHGAEMSSLGAFIKTVEILERDGVIDHFWNYGNKLKEGMKSITKEFDIENHLYLDGYACSPNYIVKDQEDNISLPFRTLFAQEMIKNKVMMPYLAFSAAHGDQELAITLEAIKNTAKIIKKALENGITSYLESPIIKPVFRRYN